MIAEKRGDVPYLIGLGFFIAAVVYFFASNWGGFERPEKIALSLAILLVCGAAALLYRRSAVFAYLGTWWLFLSVIAFAVSVALVGQMYNSHADSFMLFFVTLIPALLLAFFTRYRPLYWLSLVLFELTVWLWLYPTGTFIQYTESEQLAIYLIMAAVHVLLYGVFKRAGERYLSFAALALAQFCLVFLLNSHLFYTVLFEQTDLRFVLLHLLYIAFIFFYWRLFSKTASFHQHPVEMAVHFLAFGLYLVPNAFYIAFELFGDLLFYAGFPMLFLLFLLSIIGLRKINQSAAVKDRKWTRYMIILFTGVLAFIGTIIAISSLFSFLAILFGLSENMSIAYLTLAVVCIGIGLRIRKESWLVVRITLQVTGLAFSFVYLLDQWEAMVTPFLFAAVFGGLTAFLRKRTEAVLYFVAANGVALYGVFQLADWTFERSQWILLGAAAVNALLFLLLKQDRIQLAAYWLSLLFGLYSLTEDGWDSLIMHAAFLLWVMWHLFRPALLTRLYRFPTWAAFTGFFIWKYYEYAWLLLHKSLTFLLISAVFFAIWFLWGRHHTKPVHVLKWNQAVFAVMLVVMAAFVLTTAWQKEQLLQNGEMIALKLAPVDPRSMLQGDYVQLGYDIQNEYSDHVFGSETALPEGRIDVELAATDDVVDYNGQSIPVYETAGFASREQGRTDVIISAKGQYGTLQMGIEHFFIPENTGDEWEGKTVAIVRVAENGDALLETLR